MEERIGKSVRQCHTYILGPSVNYTSMSITCADVNSLCCSFYNASREHFHSMIFSNLSESCSGDS